MMHRVFYSFLIIYFINKSDIECYRNRLIRVDGISPTCFQKPNCREYGSLAAVINVDKSLPYMGSETCCIAFNLMNDDNEDMHIDRKEYFYMAQILNTTVLEGADYIRFYDGNQNHNNLVRTVSSLDKNPYKEIYFNSTKIIVDFFKDKNFRSIFEIAVNVYHRGNSPLCRKDDYFRCSSNTSICIHHNLVCDRYTHCPNGADEDHVCSLHLDDIGFSYDKFSVSIAIISMASIITTTLIIICLLCFLRTNKKVSRTFISLFGYKNENQNSDMLGVEYYIPINHKIKLLNEKC